MAVTRVNVGIIRNWGGAATTTLVTAATSLTAGNALIVAIGAQDVAAGSSAVTGVADTAGNTYTKVDHAYQASDFRVELWYAKNVTGHASNQVTITFTGTVQYRGAVATQYAGLDLTAPLDASAKATQASGSGITSGTLTTTVANEVHVLVARFGVTATFPAGFSDLGGDLPYLQAKEKIVSATMSGTYATSGGSFQTVILVGAFKEAATVAPGRVTQAVVELLSQPVIPARVTQAVVELLSLRPTLRGSAVFGVATTVAATRAVAFGLDGDAHTHTDAGMLKVFGDVAVTGTTTLDGTIAERGRTTPMGVWEAYTPTWTNVTVGNGTVTAKYSTVGTTVNFAVLLTFGSTTAVTGNAAVSTPSAFSAPAGPVSHGRVMTRDISAGAYYAGLSVTVSSGVIGLYTENSSAALKGMVPITATAPFTWATGDQLFLGGTYDEG